MRVHAALLLALLAAGCVEANSHPLAGTAPAPASTFDVVLPGGERFGTCPPGTVLRGYPVVAGALASYCVTVAEPARREGQFVSVYPSGKLLARGSYVDGNPDGVWSTYHESGKTLSEGTYARGVREGAWKFGQADGKPVLEEQVSAGVRTSWLEYSYDKGALHGYESFVAVPGKRSISQGRAARVRDGGNVIEGFFEADKAQGQWYEKTAKGVVVVRLTMSAGFAEGKVATFWPEDGKPSAAGEMLRTLPQGAWTLWYPSGEKRAELFYEKGLLRSITAYFPGGNKQIEGEFLDGAPHSTWTAYHPNGAVKATGAYLRGLRQGPWRLVDGAGKTLFAGSYEEGVLTEGANVEPLFWHQLGLGESLQGLLWDLGFLTSGRGRVESDQRVIAECMLLGDPAEKCFSLDWESFPAFHGQDGPAEIDRRNKQQDLACAMNDPAACARVGKRLFEAAALVVARPGKNPLAAAAGHYQKACDLAPLESAWKAREATARSMFKGFHSATACVWLGRMLDKGQIKSKALVATDLYKRACDMEIAEGCAALAEPRPKKKP